jgi:hypothetical protein
MGTIYFLFLLIVLITYELRIKKIENQLGITNKRKSLKELLFIGKHRPDELQK